MSPKTMTAARTKGADVAPWLAEQSARDPRLKRRVDALMAEMDLVEQLVALRARRGASRSAPSRTASARSNR